MALAARPGPAAELLTLSEAARLAGVDRETVRAWCDRGDLKAVRGSGRNASCLRRGTSSGSSTCAAGRRQPANRSHAGDRGPGRTRPDRRSRAATAATAADPGAAWPPARTRCAACVGAQRLGRPAAGLRGGPRELGPPVPRRSGRPVAVAPEPRAPARARRRPRPSRADPGARRAGDGRQQARRLRGAPPRDGHRLQGHRRPADHAGDARGLRQERRRVAVLRPGRVPRRARSPSSSSTTTRRYDWSPDETALARSFGDTIATAIGNARLMASVEDLAARLRAIQDLSLRLSGIQDVRGIGETIVAEAGSLIQYDTVRVYRVDHDTGWCEPIAFQGVFMGRSDPEPELLRVRIGEGLTGWVAEHGEPLLLGERPRGPAEHDRRRDDGPGIDARRADDLRGPRPGHRRRVAARPGSLRASTTRRRSRSSPAPPPRRWSTPSASSSSGSSRRSWSTSSSASAGSWPSTSSCCRPSTRRASSR